MFLYGLIVSACYIPGYLGASVPTQLVVLSATLPFALWHYAPVNLGHWLGLAVLGWAIASGRWAPSFYDAGYGLWQMSIWALAIWFGTVLDDPRELLSGLAAGLTLSSAVAVLQGLGWHPVEAMPGGLYPSGLLFNSTLLGISAAVVAVALVEFNLWAWLPGVAPALILSGSRGALLILAFGLAIRRVHWLIPCAVLALGAVALSWAPNSSDTERLLVWGEALRRLTLLGHGIGSFNTLYFTSGPRIAHAEFVHNDYLQLWFELGIGAIPAYALLALALWTPFRGRCVLASLALAGTFWSPLWCPLTAFIGCVFAGRGLASWGDHRDIRLLRRYDQLRGDPPTRREGNRSSSPPLSALPPT